MNVTTIGLDLAKSVFQVHGIGAHELTVVDATGAGDVHPITITSATARQLGLPPLQGWRSLGTPAKAAEQ